MEIKTLLLIPNNEGYRSMFQAFILGSYSHAEMPISYNTATNYYNQLKAMVEISNIDESNKQILFASIDQALLNYQQRLES